MLRIPSTVLQETTVAFQIFPAIVPIQFQGGIRVLFAIHDLTYSGHPKVWKVKGISLHIYIERLTVHQRHAHAIGHFSYKHIIFCEFRGATIKRETSDLTSLSFSFCLQRGIDCGVSTHSTQMQGGFHVRIGQGHHMFYTRATRLGAKNEKLGDIAKKFQHYFHAWGEKASRVKASRWGRTMKVTALPPRNRMLAFFRGCAASYTHPAVVGRSSLPSVTWSRGGTSN